MQLQNIYQQAEGCLLEDMGGESLLYHPETATTLHLNQPSLLVWNLCDGETPVSSIIEALQDAFPNQADQIADDVKIVIADLVKRQVLSKVN